MTPPKDNDAKCILFVIFYSSFNSNTSVLATSNNNENYSKIEFELYDSEGNIVAATKEGDGKYVRYQDSTTTTFVLGKNGTLEIDELPVGEYTVKETTNFTALNLKKSANKKGTVFYSTFNFLSF